MTIEHIYAQRNKYEATLDTAQAKHNNECREWQGAKDSKHPAHESHCYQTIASHSW